MQPICVKSVAEEFLPNHWINWCRLCAKDDKQQNIKFLYPNPQFLTNENRKLSIQEALAKYFSVQVSLEDPFSKMLCDNCLSMVSSLITFNERVQRVQLMFSYLTEAQTLGNGIDSNSIRLKFNIFDSDIDDWFKKYFLSKVERKCNGLSLNENSNQSINDDKNNVMIKLENIEKLAPGNAELEKVEIVFEENVNDPFVEGEEDPFQLDKKLKSSSDEENDQLKPTQFPSFKTDSDMAITKMERIKKIRKRKRFKPFSNIENKKKKNGITDFKMDMSCKECGTKFSKYISYREHIQQEHDHISDGDKHWPCPTCDKVLLSLRNLERHVRIHEPLEVRQTIKCPECDSRYTTKAQLESHVSYKHKNEKTFICEECGLCLRTNSNLKQHMLIHTDIAPFECEVCKKKFKNQTRLKTHMDIHSPNKHICNICGLQLNSKATLNRHFLVHSDEMQHKCDYCGKAFKRAKALKNHLLLHTGLKPYTCDFCERTFANGSNCRSHMKKIHPEELAVLEASGNKTHTKNIPKLETLKAVTKAADNLTPVVTKFSGCFAFGKKPKQLADNDAKISQRPLPKTKKPTPTQNDNEKLVVTSPSSTPLDLQYIPIVGSVTNSACLLPHNNAKSLENGLTTSTAPIPNFDNIYQHLLKQNQISPPESAASNVRTSQHNIFYQDIMNHSVKPSSEPGDDLLHSPESQSSSVVPPLTHDDHSNASLIQGTFYGTMRTALTPGNFK